MSVKQTCRVFRPALPTPVVTVGDRVDDHLCRGRPPPFFACFLCFVFVYFLFFFFFFLFFLFFFLFFFFCFSCIFLCNVFA